MKKLYIGNLPFRLHQRELEELFVDCGPIQELYLVRDRNSQRNGHRHLKGRGFGFVLFANNAGMEAALRLNGVEFRGRPLRICIANEQQSSTTDDYETDTEETSSVAGAKKQACCRWVGVILVSAVVSAATSYGLFYYYHLIH